VALKGLHSRSFHSPLIISHGLHIVRLGVENVIVLKIGFFVEIYYMHAA